MKLSKDIFRLLGDRYRPYRHLEIRQDNPISALFRKGAIRPLFNLLFLLLCLCGGIVLTLNLAIFLVRDVVLFRHELTVNRSGAIIPTKSCDTEQALFLFNTSDLWADTGIQVYRGDRIKISASGAFYSSIRDIEEAARTNQRPEYKTWIGSAHRKQQDGKPPMPDSNAIKKDTYIGAILFQIQPDAQTCVSDWYRDSLRTGEIYELTHEFGKKFHPVARTGNLHFAINDIYLNDKIIESYQSKNREKAQPLNPNDFGLESEMRKDNTLRYIGPRNSINRLLATNPMKFYLLLPGERNESGASVDTLYCSGPRVRKHFQEHRDIWYQDNLGQIALTIELQRYIPQTPARLIAGNKWWYRRLEQTIFQALDKGQWWNVLLVACLFLIGSVAAFSLLTASIATVFYSVLYLIGLPLHRPRSGPHPPEIPRPKGLSARLRRKFGK